MRNIAWVFILLLLTSCDPDVISDSNQQVEAWVPVYAQPSQLTEIGVAPVRSTVKAGKIYAYGNYIFQNDLYTGFHIINNSVPAAAQKVAFLKIPFCSEIAIRGNYLYTNSVSDLLVFNLADPLQPALVKRVPNAFPLIAQDHPSQSGYFECVDPSKGVVVDWELRMINMPKCRR